MRLLRRWDRPLPLVLTTGAAAVAFGGAVAVMSAIAGWSRVADRFHPGLSVWFGVAFVAELAAFAAYVLAYRSVAAVEQGPRLGLREATELVAVGFGAFLAKGGAALDSEALRRGSSERDGEVRVMALDALEHAPLAPAACAAAITLLVRGSRTPGLDFTIPWATLVPVGAVLAFFGVRRRRRRFTGRGGWRGKLGEALEAIEVLFRLARGWRVHWPAFVGASVYWAGDVLCLWASLRPFDAAPTFAAIVLAHAVGYVLTRRTLPLAGAGIVEVLLPLTLVASGAPFAGAILGVVVYRLFNLWLPLLPAAAALPRLRRRLGGSFRLLPAERVSADRARG